MHRAKFGETGTVTSDPGDNDESAAVLLSKAVLSTEIPLRLLESAEGLVKPKVLTGLVRVSKQLK